MDHDEEEGFPFMSEEALGFHAKIAANPKDPNPRLVYADWLEEHGNTSLARKVREVARQVAEANKVP